MNDLLILGGGASGLSLGLLTGATVLESQSEPGGHSLSMMVDGYTYDRGPHIMFSRSEFLLKCMIASLGDNVHQCVRNNKVSVKKKLLKYPIENDLGSLEKPDLISCISAFVKSQIRLAASTSEINNLAQWFNIHFGEALTELYFRPYNEKIWKTKLENLSMLWAERIPLPPVEDVIKSAFGESTEGYLHQLYYHYPKVGGYSALMNSWASGLAAEQIKLSTEVIEIVPNDGYLEVRTNEGSLKAKKIASTIPLSKLPSIIKTIPKNIVECIDRLRTNATAIVTLGFEGIDHNQWTAVYIPDEDFLPNRISYPAVFSPENAPPNHFLIQSEIICPTLSELDHLSDEDLITHTFEGLQSRDLIPEGAILRTKYVERYELAYVVYTAGYENDLNQVINWARELGIFLHGRFGSHNYLNVDGCLEQSISLARELGFNLSDSQIISKFEALGKKSI